MSFTCSPVECQDFELFVAFILLLLMNSSNERRRLASANIAALPNSSTTHVVSGRTPDFDNVTGNLKKNQEALDGNQNIRKKGKR